MIPPQTVMPDQDSRAWTKDAEEPIDEAQRQAMVRRERQGREMNPHAYRRRIRAGDETSGLALG